MSNSLRDQLVGLGFKSAPAKKPKPVGKHGRDGDARGKGRGGKFGKKSDNKPDNQPKSGGRSRKREDIDLAKAYAIRAQKEKDERIAADKARQEEARKRREARAKLAELVEGKALNSDEADIARHFEYGGKIKRIYVTIDQLKALNAGELGVIQLNGRYLLVTAGLLAQAEQIFAHAVALKVDPGASTEDDPYSDPKYQVPDDLVW